MNVRRKKREKGEERNRERETPVILMYCMLKLLNSVMPTATALLDFAFL